MGWRMCMEIAGDNLVLIYTIVVGMRGFMSQHIIVTMVYKNILTYNVVRYQKIPTLPIAILHVCIEMTMNWVYLNLQ